MGSRDPGSFRLTAALAVSSALVVGQPALGKGFLEGLRQAVRFPRLASSSQPAEEKGSEWEEPEKKVVVEHRHRHYHYEDGEDDDDGLSGQFLLGGVVIGTCLATSPWWGPPKLLGDDYSSGGFFPHYPYEGVPGYMMIGPKEADARPCALDFPPEMRQALLNPWPARPRRWSGRLRAEYAGDMDSVERLGGRLLLSTASRWGLDTEMSYFEEVLSSRERDQLGLGDFNVVLRFAQDERAEFRTGVGFNWLDDPQGTDFGFNFTYGVDIFPRRPWVFSGDLDWGTLGRGELFRIRFTAGVVLRGVEFYTGYEYLDVDASTFNGLIGGIQIWF